MVYSPYLRKLLTPTDLEYTLKKLVKALKPHVDKFDTIAFTGMSGAMIGPLLAMKLGKQMLMVRKDDIPRHSYSCIEGNLAAVKYIIVDDLVASGNTLKNIISKITPGWGMVGYAQCVGLALFNQPEHDYKDRVDEVSYRTFNIIGWDSFIVNP